MTSLAAANASAAGPVVGRFALDRYEPTPAGDRFFDVASPSVAGSFALRAGVSLDYAHDPLLLRGAQGDVLGSAVSSQLVMHVGASLALWSQVLLSLSLPLAVVSDGDDPADRQSAAASPTGAAPGDVRLGVRIHLAGAARDPAVVALGNYLWFPTGDPGKYTGDAGMRSMPHLAFGGSAASLVYGAQAGVLFREATEVLDIRIGTAATCGLAAGYEAVGERLVVGVELFGSTLLASGVKPTHAELHGTARLRLGDFALGAAAGPGLGRAVGTPAFRVVSTFQYAPR